MLELVSFIILIFIDINNGASSSVWKEQSIYQVLTDRFNKPGTTSSCNDLSSYCGGTFKGIIDQIEYIKSLGFTAIWISPVVANTQNGYHGYWAQNIYDINPYYGSESDLIELANTLHDNNMLLMIDVVANHMGPTDINNLYPYNQSSYYHDCSKCPNGCNIENFDYQCEEQWCRLSGLPDLDQTNSYVKSTLLSWISDYVVNKWKADGIRIDTIPELESASGYICNEYVGFWKEFQDSAGVFAMGEIFDGNPSNVAPYQNSLNSTLSYPMYYTIRKVFGDKGNMQQIDGQFSVYQSDFKDYTVLGTFVDNHDNDRFLCDYSDDASNNQYRRYINAYTFALTIPGIPITYYGSEQGYQGWNNKCSDPNNRQSLWQTQFNPNNTPIGQAITVINNARNKFKIWNYDMNTHASEDHFYAFTRGNNFFVALTNVGANGQTNEYTVNNPGLNSGTKYCNIFWPLNDCFTYNGGSQNIYLLNGESKIYVAASELKNNWHLININVFNHTYDDTFKLGEQWESFY